MSESKASPKLTITDPHNVLTTFVSDIASSGYGNGVVNMTFVTARFTPTGTEKDDLIPDLIISNRLRMDMYCAQRLYEQLDHIIKTQKTASAGGTPN